MEMKHLSVGLAVHCLFEFSISWINSTWWYLCYLHLIDYGILWHTIQWDEVSSDASDLFPVRISVRNPDILTEDFVGSVRPYTKILNSK